jgi:hypothetical protein
VTPRARAVKKMKESRLMVPAPLARELARARARAIDERRRG